MFSHGAFTGVEALTAEASLAAFAARQVAVTNTVHELGFTHDEAVLVGTAGLAVHGLNAHLEVGSGTDFDVDVIVSETTFHELQATSGLKTDPGEAPNTIHIPGSETRLPTTIIAASLLPNLGFSHPETFNELTESASVIGGILVPPATELAQNKLDRGDLTDNGGILQAHIVAWATGHPIATDRSWQRQVVGAKNALMRRPELLPRLKRTSIHWLYELAMSGFGHDALTSLYSPMQETHKLAS